MTEIAFVLKAVATLVSTLKKTPSANGKCTLLLFCVLFTNLVNIIVLMQR